MDIIIWLSSLPTAQHALHNPVATSRTQQSVPSTFTSQHATQFKKLSEELWFVTNTVKVALEFLNS